MIDAFDRAPPPPSGSRSRHERRTTRKGLLYLSMCCSVIALVRYSGKLLALIKGFVARSLARSFALSRERGFESVANRRTNVQAAEGTAPATFNVMFGSTAPLPSSLGLQQPAQLVRQIDVALQLIGRAAGVRRARNVEHPLHFLIRFPLRSANLVNSPSASPSPSALLASPSSPCLRKQKHIHTHACIHAHLKDCSHVPKHDRGFAAVGQSG